MALWLKYKEFLKDVESTKKEKELLQDIIESNIEKLQGGDYKIQTLKKVWKVIQEAASDVIQDHFEEGGDLQTEPQQKQNKTSSPRQKMIDNFFSMGEKMGIKSKADISQGQMLWKIG